MACPVFFMCCTFTYLIGKISAWMQSHVTTLAKRRKYNSQSLFSPLSQKLLKIGHFEDSYKSAVMTYQIDCRQKGTSVSPMENLCPSIVQIEIPKWFGSSSPKDCMATVPFLFS